jgi:hypothetical protein
VSREFGCSEDPGYNSAVPTDPGLGPDSSKPDGSKDKDGPEESGVQERPKQVDSVEAVLEGFGAQRPDRPRIKPLPEPTPVPDAPVQRRGLRPKDGSTTSPGRRQIETRRRYGAFVVVLLCVIVVCFVAWKMHGSDAPETVSTSTNATLPPPAPTPTETSTSSPGIPVENLTPSPTETAVATVQPTGPIKVLPTAKTAAPTVSVPATTAAPTTSGPDPKNDVKRTM